MNRASFNESARIFHSLAVVNAMLAVTTIAACGGPDADPHSGSTISSISVNPPSIVLQPGATEQFTAAVSGSGDLSVVWSVREADKGGMIDSYGLYTAPHAEGLFHVVATSRANPAKSASSTVAVAEAKSSAVASVKLVLSSSTLAVGQTAQATPTLTDGNGNVLTGRVVTYSSSDTVVATVTATGLVSAVAPGVATINAVSEGQRGSATLTVTPPPASWSISCTPAAVRLPAGTTGTVACIISSQGDFSGDVRLAVSGLPAGVTLAQFENRNIHLRPGAPVTVYLEITAEDRTAPGFYQGVSVSAVGAAGTSAAAALPLTITMHAPRVRMIYLIPSDRTVDSQVVLGMERAIRDLQIFYGVQMGDRTFAIHAPVVELFQSAQPASWFQQDVWGHTTAETFALTGGHFNDTQNVWVIYLDVITPAPQVIGGTSSVAVLSRDDVLGISNEDTRGAGLCRWVGGLGHELGHAFGLPHPPGCDAGAPDCERSVLMFLGYINYPKTYLNGTETSQLRSTSFFQSGSVVTPMLFDCSVLGPEPVASTDH